MLTLSAHSTTYYNVSGGNADVLSNWGTAANGTGAAPANFTTAGDIFNINNGIMYNSAAWTTGAGVTVNINSTFNPGSTYVITLNGTVNVNTGGTYDNNTSGATTINVLNVNGTATFIQDYTGTLSFTSATFSSTSNFTFNRGSNRFNGISQFNFGNLTFNDAFDGPPTLPAATALRVQGNLSLLDVYSNFVLSTTGSLTHTIGGNLNMNLASGSEYFYIGNGTGSPTLNIGGVISYLGSGGCFVNNGSGTVTLNVNGAGTSTFNNSFSDFIICNNSGGAIVNFTGPISHISGYVDVKSLVATGLVVPVVTISGMTTISGGTFSGNRSAVTGSSVTVNFSGGVTQSAGQFTGSSNMGNATFNIGNSAVAKDLNQTGGTVHVSNDVDNAGATVGNVTFNIYGSIILSAAGHFDLSYEAVGGNNSINVGGSATAPSGAIFGGPHCWNRNNCTTTLTLKSPATAGWAIATATGNLSMTTGDYDASILCTGSNSRQGIGQFNVVIESGKTVTLNSDIEPGDNRTFDVYGTLITYSGGTQYKTARRFAAYDNPVLGVPQPANGGSGAYATNCWTYVRAAATIDAGDVNGLTIENTYSGSVQTAKRHYNSAGNYKFTQSAAQVTGNFITATTPSLNTVNSIIVNNSNATVTTGLTLSNSVTITSSLQFLLGRFKTTSASFPTIDVAGTASGFSTTNASTAGTASFVDGPIRKIMNTATTFIFPTGKSSGTAMYRPFAITPGTTTSDTYEAELINTAPTASGYNAASLLAPLNWNNNTYFWWLTSGTGSVSNIVRPYYIDADLSPAPKPFNIYAVATEWNSGTTKWESKGRSVVDSTSGAGGTFLHYVESGAGLFIPTGITNRVRPFNIGTESNYLALPIELLSFSASNLINSVQVKWSTETETNNDYFTLERSSDGTNFEFVNKIKGAGNSITEKQYSYIDTKPYSGITYYRLRQTDYNGRFTESNIVSVKKNGQNTGVAFPNPAADFIFIPIQEDANNSVLKIYNKEGILLYSKSIILPEDSLLKVNLENYPAGTYFISLYLSNGEIHNQKILK